MRIIRVRSIAVKRWRSLALAPVLWLAAPLLAQAQQPGGVDRAEMMRRMQDPAAMQRMAAQMEAAQACMQEIDQAKLDALEKRTRTMSQEVESLCKAGRRTEALARARAFGQEMRSDETVLKLRECSKGMADMARDAPWSRVPGVADEREPTEQDICS